MKILVCMKQVPASSKVDIDPETGAMKRMSGETRTNPYDLFALDVSNGTEALDLAFLCDELEKYMKPVLKQNSQKLKLQQKTVIHVK